MVTSAANQRGGTVSTKLIMANRSVRVARKLRPDTVRLAFPPTLHNAPQSVFLPPNLRPVPKRDSRPRIISDAWNIHTNWLYAGIYILFLKVSTPLALNIYTAVHNPISVKGRIQLCRGALAHVDTRPVLPEINVPVICVHSTQNNFVKPLHTDPYVTRRGGEVRSIHKVEETPCVSRTHLFFVSLTLRFPLRMLYSQQIIYYILIIYCRPPPK